jgi:ABC-type antimicrobial peptide transport system permease subunit
MAETPHSGEWPLLYYLKGITGVSLIEYEGKRRYLPTIIVEAMKKAKRPLKEIAWAPSIAELKAKGY